MALDQPRCQALIGRRKSGEPRRCGRPIQYVMGGVYAGWEHVPFGNPHHLIDIVPDPDWIVDHDRKCVVPAARPEETNR